MQNAIPMDYSTVLMFGLILISGFIAGKIANFLKLPKITGYIAVGVLLEPSFLGVIPGAFIKSSSTISNFALCIITYAIGGSLCFRRIKTLGKSIVWMTLLEAETAFLLVFGGLFVALPLLSHISGLTIDARYYLPLALLAGALASPTDPTAALAVKEEYEAEGPVTSTILSIAAFDDATGIINFTIGIAVSMAVLGGSSGSLTGTILHPVIVIVSSVLMGAAFGALLLFTARNIINKGTIIVLILGALFACFGMAQFLGLDELLCTMVLGMVVVNFSSDDNKFFLSIRDYFEEVVFLIFFVLAGAHLQLGVLKSCLWIVLVFVILRTVGKIVGVYLGALISGAEPVVKKYTAFGLIPQGGIVVGLALLVKENPHFSDISTFLLNLILGTTVFHEFIGPLFAEMGLKKAKEVKVEE